MPQMSILSSLCFLHLLYEGWGSNWAQVTGVRTQNNALPYTPGLTRPHWSARDGLAVAVLPGVNGSSKAEMLVLGGNTLDGGKRNDVWAASSSSPLGEIWTILEEALNQPSGAELDGLNSPIIRSTVSFSLRNEGSSPPPQVTYKEWIQCADAMISFGPIGVREGKFAVAKENVDCSSPNDQTAIWTQDIMWTERSFHQAVVYGTTIFLLGGQSAEDASATNKYSVLKNDVWFSNDGGIRWVLSNPGTEHLVNQLDLSSTATRPPKQNVCKTREDCYGNSYCSLRETYSVWPPYATSSGRCVSLMWSPRMKHRALVQGNFLYVAGGFSETSEGVCGTYACGSRVIAMNDVWRADLASSWVAMRWEQLSSFDSHGRANFGLTAMRLYGEAALWAATKAANTSKMSDPSIAKAGLQCMFITGGELLGGKVLNDIRVAVVSNGDLVPLSNWFKFDLFEIPWTPRAGHSASTILAAGENIFERMIIYGGYGHDGSDSRDMVWSWGTQCRGQKFDEGRNCIDLELSAWVQDYTAEAWYKYRVQMEGGASCLIYSNGTPPDYCRGAGTVSSMGPPSPQSDYVGEHTLLNKMTKLYLPGEFWPSSLDPSVLNQNDGSSLFGSPGLRLSILSDLSISKLSSLGIYTIRDLANANLYTVLQLRGYGLNSKQNYVENICTAKNLAVEIASKCGGFKMPIADVSARSAILECNVDPSSRDYACSWDGCAQIGDIQTFPFVNVFGIGDVPQNIIRDEVHPHSFTCQSNPGSRFNHASAVFDGKLFVLGGSSSTAAGVPQTSFADAWYRDDELPSTSIIKASLEESKFEVATSEIARTEACLYNRGLSSFVVPWHAVDNQIDVSIAVQGKYPGWVHQPSGRYRVYAKGVDVAGNPVPTYISKSSGGNMVVWRQRSTQPTLLIVSIVSLCVSIFFACLGAYHKAQRELALKNYALRRIRRKFQLARKVELAKMSAKRAAGIEDTEKGIERSVRRAERKPRRRKE